MEIIIPINENPCLDCRDYYMNKCVKSAYCMKLACYRQQEKIIHDIRELNLGISIIRVKNGNRSTTDGG